MKKTKTFSSMAAVVGLLFIAGLAFSNGSRFGISAALVEEREADEIDSEKQDVAEEKDSEDEAETEKDNESESEKSKEERGIKSINQKIEDNGGEENETDEVDEVDEIDEVDEAESESNDLQEEIQDLNKDIVKLESKISVLGASGVVVTSFEESLMEIKDLASQFEAKTAANPQAAEALLEMADQKLERLKKLVKLALGDEEESDDDSDAAEEVRDLAKEIVEIEAELAIAADKGVDVSALRTALDEIKGLLNQANEKVAAGDLAGAEAITEVADKKLENLDHSMELALGETDEQDEDEAGEYKNRIAQLVHDLKEIGGIDAGIGQQVSLIAQTQNDSTAKVENSINDIKSRSELLKFLIGPKYGSISDVQTAIAENQTRIEVLSNLAGQAVDPAVKLVLQDQIRALQEQNNNLQSFVADSEKGVSLLGWLVRLLS